MDFETALREQISKRKATRRAKRILAILDAPKSARRSRQIQRMRDTAAGAAGLAGVSGIDWSKVDWAKLFEVVLSILLKLLVAL